MVSGDRVTQVISVSKTIELFCLHAFTLVPLIYNYLECKQGKLQK